MLAASAFMIVFRFLHIVAGTLWVGSAFLFGVFIGPSAAEVGPSAGPLLAVMVKKRKVARVILGLTVTTLLAGWIMWLRDMDQAGGLGNWLGSSFGLALTVGGVLATIAGVVGYLGIGQNVERLVDLGGEIAASGRAAHARTGGAIGASPVRGQEARPDRPDPAAHRGCRDGDRTLLVGAGRPMASRNATTPRRVIPTGASSVAAVVVRFASLVRRARDPSRRWRYGRRPGRRGRIARCYPGH